MTFGREEDVVFGRSAGSEGAKEMLREGVSGRSEGGGTGAGEGEGVRVAGHVKAAASAGGSAIVIASSSSCSGAG